MRHELAVEINRTNSCFRTDPERLRGIKRPPKLVMPDQAAFVGPSTT